MHTADDINSQWFHILEIIGGYIINKTNDNSTVQLELNTTDNTITKVLCGYWLLYTIAVAYEDDK